MLSFQTTETAKAYLDFINSRPLRKTKVEELKKIVEAQEKIEENRSVHSGGKGLTDYTSMRGLLGDYAEQETPTLGAFDVWRKRNLGG